MLKISGLGRYFLPFFTLLTYLFLYIPIIILIIFSFNQSGQLNQWGGFSTKWYYELFQNDIIWDAFKNSLVVALSSMALSVTLGVGLVYGFGRRMQDFFGFFYGSVIVPEIVLGVGLLSIFSILKVPLGMTTLIAGHTLLGLGFVIPIVHGRYLEIGQQYSEASFDLGASELQTFFRVILPLLRPALVASSLLVMVISFDDFLISFFCAGASTQTLSLYIFAMIRTGISPVVNALSTCILLGSSIIVYLFSTSQAAPLEDMA
ncbi:MAG: ABC transporter permease [Candidatus Babeliales bacterium]